MNKASLTIWLKAKVVKALPLVVRKRLPREVEVIEISRREAKRLNQKYRRKNKPANVLSFRYGSCIGISKFLRKSATAASDAAPAKRGLRGSAICAKRRCPDYGEILVCPEVVRREAREQGNTYKYQMTWMIIHGILHLAELHHERSKKAARRVELLERQILNKLFSQVEF